MGGNTLFPSSYFAEGLHRGGAECVNNTLYIKAEVGNFYKNNF